jgi:ATP-dependent protease ClpP protease subunit
MKPLSVAGWIGKDVTLAHVRDHLRQAGTGLAEFRISCEGGSGTESLYIGEAIVRHGGPTVGRVIRHCNSGAILVFAACRRRIASSGARFSFHPPIKTWPSTTPEELESYAARYIAFLCENVAVSWNYVEILMRDSVTLTAREALQLRLVTEII